MYRILVIITFGILSSFSSIYAEGSVTVSGKVTEKALRSVDFTSVVYDNSEKTTHEAYHIKPVQRLAFYYEMAIAIILIPAGMFVAIIIWLKKKPKIPEGKSSAV